MYGQVLTESIRFKVVLEVKVSRTSQDQEYKSFGFWEESHGFLCMRYEVRKLTGAKL
jgi:hypothetical protein